MRQPARPPKEVLVRLGTAAGWCAHGAARNAAAAMAAGGTANTDAGITSRTASGAARNAAVAATAGKADCAAGFTSRAMPGVARTAVEAGAKQMASLGSSAGFGAARIAATETAARTARSAGGVLKDAGAAAPKAAGGKGNIPF